MVLQEQTIMDREHASAVPRGASVVREQSMVGWSQPIIVPGKTMAGWDHAMMDQSDASVVQRETMVDQEQTIVGWNETIVDQNHPIVTRPPHG